MTFSAEKGINPSEDISPYEGFNAKGKINPNGKFDPTKSIAAIHAFTAAATSFSMGNEQPQPPAEPDGTARHLRRVLAALERSGKDTLVLYGLGSGALAGELARALPEQISLLVVGLSPEGYRALARTEKNAWVQPNRGRGILCDTSPWAAVHLLALHGFTPDHAYHMANPDPGCARVEELREVQRILATSPITSRPTGRNNSRVETTDRDSDSSALGTTAPHRPTLSAAAILHPDEPGLIEYFAQFPAWLHEVVVVWDAQTPPRDIPPCAVPVKHLAHTLDSGFADQRNRMLEACTGDWILYLDGDERLVAGATEVDDMDDKKDAADTGSAPSFWDELPGVLSTSTKDHYAGFYFPRTTFDPDESSCRVGFGLWPDLQLRLFRRTEALEFVNPIHEKIMGMEGPVGVLLNRSIGHESVLRKSAEAIRQKLARFDHASGNSVRHRLNETYPTLPCSLLADPQGPYASPRWLRLPANPA